MGKSVVIALFLAVLAAGGCTLLASGELSGKPSVAAGGQGGGGEGGAGGAAGGGGEAGEGGMGGPPPMCPPGRGNCDGISWNGCEIDLEEDDKNCGKCGTKCMKDKHCGKGQCK